MGIRSTITKKGISKVGKKGVVDSLRGLKANKEGANKRD
jgi:hypothetical protein